MALQKLVVAKGQSTNRPPLFDGFNCPYWSTRMLIYIRAINYEMWDIIIDGPFIPSTLNVVTNEMIPKQRIIHEETCQVKESKIALLTYNYEMFKMEPGEDITRMLDRFTNITNKLSQLGKPILEYEVVKRLIRSLPKNWKPKV
ncbi:Uncharacterized protein TCM_022771 [Theobroma cacao]|uniref:DUF4219 domain-containing protein n=1 Tax=Theobroma cacao TaxID=3641 RepID=A0A061EUA0_THECC|nr:Uncharacterized protein TCM_022771 [Theobroma cacao]